MCRSALITLCSALVGMLATGCTYYTRTVEPDFVAMGPEQVLQMAAGDAGRMEDLNTVATLQIQSLQGSFMTRVTALYADPDSIRIDVSVALGGVALQALMLGPRLQVYFPLQKAVVEGELRPGEVVEIQGIMIDESVLRELVLGPGLTWSWVDLAARLDQYDVGPDQVNFGFPLADGSRLLLCLNRDLSWCRSVRFAPGGKVLREIIFEEYRRTGQARLPQRAVLRYPDQALVLVLEVVRRIHDPPRTPGDFVLQLPPGVTRLTTGIPPAGREGARR